MARGILETVGIAGSFVLAAPVALFGLQRLIEGDPLAGAGYLAVAGLMLWLPRFVTTPDDVAVGAVERTVGWVVGSDDENRE